MESFFFFFLKDILANDNNFLGVFLACVTSYPWGQFFSLTFSGFFFLTFIYLFLFCFICACLFIIVFGSSMLFLPFSHHKEEWMLNELEWKELIYDFFFLCAVVFWQTKLAQNWEINISEGSCWLCGWKCFLMRVMTRRRVSACYMYFAVQTQHFGISIEFVLHLFAYICWPKCTSQVTKAKSSFCTNKVEIILAHLGFSLTLCATSITK